MHQSAWLVRGVIVACALAVSVTGASAQSSLAGASPAEPSATAPPSSPAPPPSDPSLDEATVVADAPMYWLRDTSRTPIRHLAAGTTVRIVRRLGGWYEVVYHDPKYGDERGFVTVASLRPGAGEPGGGAGTGVLSQRGFVELRGAGFPQDAPVDSTRGVSDFLFRDDVFLKPARWLQLSTGVDVRANSHGQVSDDWELDTDDRGLLRPRLALRRAAVSITTSHFTLDVGKQFIRWGRADILNPTDRFAPKDYMNPIDSEFLPVTGARSSIRVGSETIEGVWVRTMTPSRLPLLTQRWTVLPAGVSPQALVDRGSVFPADREVGARWMHSGRFDLGASVFDGFNHLPTIDVQGNPVSHTIEFLRWYAPLRSYGAELSLPTSVITVKGEASLFTSPDNSSEEYVLYVIEGERQVGEWVVDVGYVGERVTTSRPELPFGAERGIARSFIGRVSYSMNPRRTMAVESAVRQKGEGYYVKGELSQAFGAHWRLTVSGVGLGGDDTDFLGAYRRNSSASAALRASF